MSQENIRRELAAKRGPIRIDSKAGHGAGKPTSKIIEERADMLAFIANTFKMPVAQP